MNHSIEICPLSESNCFTVSSQIKSEFILPIHHHDCYELTLIKNAKGLKRIVGDHIGETENYELILLSPILPHTWQIHKCKSYEATEVNIHFHKDLFDDKFLQRSRLFPIKTMLENASRGILFSSNTSSLMSYKIMRLYNSDGFSAVIDFLTILHELSTATNYEILSSSSFNNSDYSSYKSERVDQVIEYLNKNYTNNITLSDVASITNMAESAFCRFFKKQTGNTYIDLLTEIRLGHASKMLINTSLSVSEIAYACGFNNISNFNRIFKKRKGYTPKEFKKVYFAETKYFI